MVDFCYRKRKILITIAVILLVVVAICVNGSPVNLHFNIEEGYYTEDVTLKINPIYLGKAYYTLDGSEPTTKSEPYTGKIELTNAKQLPNSDSGRADTSVGFDEEVLEKYGFTPPGYRVPDYNVDKIYYVRVAGYDFFGNKYDEVAGTFLVNLDDNSTYDHIAVASITMDEKDLWDYDDGIYNTGRLWDDFYKQIDEGAIENIQDTSWCFWNANYLGDGITSEKKCTFQFYDEEKNLVLKQDCGIRIQGSGSKAENQKGFALFAREEYERGDSFNADLTGSGYLQDKYILTSGGQDQISKLSDYLVQQASTDMPYGTMDMRPCVLFLNGEFWGMYYIEEPYNLTYLENHYGVNQNDVMVYKNGFLEEGLAGDEKEYEEMYSFITEGDMTIAKNYEKACELIDIDNYAAYSATMLYLGRVGDWPVGNEMAWRTRKIDSDNEYADGRWRFMLFDLNSRDEEFGEFAMENARVDNVADGLVNSMFNHLFQNDDFKQRIADYLQELALEEYDKDKMASIVDNYLAVCYEPLCASDKRFYGDEHREEILANASNKKYYFARRRDICKHMILYMLGGQYLWDGWN